MAAVAAIVLLQATGGVGRLLSGQAASTSGTLQVGGIEQAISIVRDSAGVPHIFAASERDAVFGLGFVHAQDRRLQMELLRRLGRGESASMTGASALPTDRLMRTLGVWRLAQQEAALLTAPERRLHEAYAAGVNAGSETGGWPSGMLARALAVKSEPWTVADCILLLKLATVGYATQYREELLTAALTRTTGAKLRWYNAVEPADRAVTVASGSNPGTGPHEPRPPSHALSPFEYVAALRDVVRLIDPVVSGAGSNSWVVAGSRTTTGKPILASDPHMALSTPSGIYAAHLSAPGFQVTGVGIPGIPGFFHGLNDRIAWGVTVTGADGEDLYLEELTAAAGEDRVRRKAGTAPLEIHEETIPVRNEAPVVHRVRRSSFGPLISDAMPALLTSALPADAAADRCALALEATALDAAPPGWYLHIARARNWEEFRAALSRYSGPTFNFMYADVDGHIGFQMAGLLPARRGPAPEVPIPAWEADDGVSGRVPFDSMPSVLDPPRGWIATGNARMVDDMHPVFVSRRWGDLSWRVSRVRDLLQRSARVSPKDVIAIQLDVHQESMRAIVSWTRDAASADTEVQRLLERLDGWDLDASKDSAAQTIAEAFRVELMRDVFGADLPPALLDAYIAMPTFASPALEAIMSDPKAAFFGPDVAAAREARRQAIGRALRAARKSLEEKLGARDPLPWGHRHTLTFRSPYAQGRGLAPWLLGRWLNVGPFEMPGSNTTVNASAWHPNHWFEVMHGAGYRQVIDLADLSASRYLPPPPGQSEHARSPFYSNLAGPAARGEYVRMLWTREDIEADAAATLTLRP